MSAQKTTDLKAKYINEVRNQLKEEFKLTNEMQKIGRASCRERV